MPRPPRITDPRPLHQRIAADLRDDIMSGAFGPGTALPTTAQLVERFGAANATVQKALQVLKDEGLVVGRRGASIEVRDHRQRTIRPASTVTSADPGEPWRWIAHTAEMGHQGSSQLLHVGAVRAPVDVAKAFGLPEGDKVLIRSQILMLDGEPAELADCYYPLDLVRGTTMMERRKIRGGTARLLAELGYPPRKVIDLVSARVPTRREYEALELPSDLPVLRTFRVVLSDDDRPIEATVMANASHLYQLQYEIP